MITQTFDGAVDLLSRIVEQPWHEGSCDCDIFGDTEECLLCKYAQNALLSEAHGFLELYRLLQRRRTPGRTQSFLKSRMEE